MKYKDEIQRVSDLGDRLLLKCYKEKNTAKQEGYKKKFLKARKRLEDLLIKGGYIK